MKNIEKIRNMSAEELAEFLENSRCCAYNDTDRCDNRSCEQGIAAWLEQEAEKPKKPTDAELIQAAELLKANCKNQKDCNKCIFLSKVCCKFEYKTPEEWELLHRKTRMELLLEKFPDAKINGNGLPESCANHLGLASGCEGLVDGNCTACWNAPAESEAQDETD